MQREGGGPGRGVGEGVGGRSEGGRVLPPDYFEPSDDRRRMINHRERKSRDLFSIAINTGLFGNKTRSEER